MIRKNKRQRSQSENLKNLRNNIIDNQNLQIDHKIDTKEILYEEGSPDQEKDLKGDQDQIWKQREAKQAHEFRDSAFNFAIAATCILGIVWFLAIVFYWPCVDDIKEPKFILTCLKSSLLTVVLLICFVCTLRFAIKCYGHHNSKDDKDNSPISISDFLKTLSTIASKSQGN